MPTPDVPERFTAGDTFSILGVGFAGYPAPTWSLQLVLANRYGQQVITSTPNGSTHDLTETAANTALWVPGVWSWQAYATDGTTRATVAQGQLTVERNLATALAGDETRSTWEQIRDDLLAALAKFVSDPHRGAMSSFSIGGRSRVYRSIAEIRAELQGVEAEIAHERRKAKIAAGLRGQARTIRQRWNG